MTLPLISAGEFFELLRPAASVLSVLISAFVLASARRIGVRLHWAFAWALGAFILPFVVLPLYLLVRLFRNRRGDLTGHDIAATESPATQQLRFRFLLPAAYAILTLSLAGIYFYRDYNTVDAHLARASQAKLRSGPAKVIREYRAALALEDNAHTHKLLGLELAEAGQWSEALNELRLAERGGEPDESLPFRIAEALKASGEHSAALLEYRRFLNSHACTQQLPDTRCEVARRAFEEKRPLSSSVKMLFVTQLQAQGFLGRLYHRRRDCDFDLVHLAILRSRYFEGQ